jgi:hypothetical protein
VNRALSARECVLSEVVLNGNRFGSTPAHLQVSAWGQNEGVTADQVIARYVDAIGGADKFSSITTFLEKGDVSGNLTSFPPPDIPSLLVAVFWALFAIATFPSTSERMRDAWTLVCLTCPIAIAGRHHPVSLYEVLAANTVTYALFGLIVQALRHPLHHAKS